MPIKSQAQRRKFAELLVKGEISEEVYERWNREAGSKVLPERVKPGAGAKSKRKGTAKRKIAAKSTSARRSTTKRKATKRSRRTR
jgi:hypothetical protein